MTPTLENFKSSRPDHAELIQAVVNQMCGWGTFTNCARDIVNHGISGGFPGFIYYSETVVFAARNRRAIVDRINEYATDSETEGGALGVLRTSKYDIQDLEEEQAAMWYLSLAPLSAEEVHDKGFTGIWNWFAWFAAEMVANEYWDWFDEVAGGEEVGA